TLQPEGLTDISRGLRSLRRYPRTAHRHNGHPGGVPAIVMEAAVDLIKSQLEAINSACSTLSLKLSTSLETNPTQKPATPIEQPPNKTAFIGLSPSRCFINNPRPSEARICGMTMKKLKTPM